jgi:hypothetical protein
VSCAADAICLIQTPADHETLARGSGLEFLEKTPQINIIANYFDFMW